MKSYGFSRSPVARVFSTVVLVALAADVHAWVIRERPADGYAAANALTMGTDGHPVIAGMRSEPAPSTLSDFLVEKRAASDGSLIWSYVAPDGVVPDCYTEARHVRTDAAGNIVAAGSARTLDASTVDVILVKLDGDDGTELWRVDLANLDDDGLDDVVLTADGDVLLIGYRGTFPTYYSEVTRFDGTTGATEWTATVAGTAGTGFGYTLAVDQAGGVFYGASLNDVGDSNRFTVGKLDGGTGVELWRTTLVGETHGTAGTVAVDAGGNVIAGGHVTIASGLYPVVGKFSGATGAPSWRYDVSGPPDNFGSAGALVLDAAGDVYLTGLTGETPSWLAAKVTGGTGAEVWRHELDGDEFGVGSAVSLDAIGVPVFAGQMDNQFTLLGFDPTGGAPLWSYALPGDTHNSGSARDLRIDAGYVFAAGVSNFPLIPENFNETFARTLVRIPNPTTPPVVGNCAPAPRNDCRLPTEPRKAQLYLKRIPGPRRDVLQWKWTKGEATTTGDFGDALNAATTYSFCLYDGTGTPVFSAAVLGDGTCGTRPCWRSLGGTGYVYKTKNREPEGVDAITLKSGAAGSAKVVVKRKERRDLDLLLPPLAGLTLPLTTQFQHDGGVCFSATFSAAGVLVNDGVKLKARSD